MYHSYTKAWQVCKAAVVGRFLRRFAFSSILPDQIFIMWIKVGRYVMTYNVSWSRPPLAVIGLPWEQRIMHIKIQHA